MNGNLVRFVDKVPMEKLDRLDTAPATKLGPFPNLTQEDCPKGETPYRADTFHSQYLKVRGDYLTDFWVRVGFPKIISSGGPGLLHMRRIGLYNFSRPLVWLPLFEL